MNPRRHVLVVDTAMMIFCGALLGALGVFYLTSTPVTVIEPVAAVVTIDAGGNWLAAAYTSAGDYRLAELGDHRVPLAGAPRVAVSVAQHPGASGAVWCEIRVDGRVVDRETGDGTLGLALCVWGAS